MQRDIKGIKGNIIVLTFSLFMRQTVPFVTIGSEFIRLGMILTIVFSSNARWVHICIQMQIFELINVTKNSPMITYSPLFHCRLYLHL